MIRPLSEGVGGGLRRVDLAGAAHLELVSGVVQLRPEDAMVEAMLRGWRAQQTRPGAAGGHDRRAGAAGAPVPGVHQRVPVAVGSGACGRVVAVADRRATIWRRRRSAATRPICGCSASTSDDGRYGWAVACEEAFGTRSSGADLPRVEHHRAPQRLRGQPGGAPVHPGGVAAVPRLRRRPGRAGGPRPSARARWPPTGTPRCSR